MDLNEFAGREKRDTTDRGRSCRLSKYPLTPREGDICELLLQGLQVKEVAGRLNISDRTADHHRQNLYSKLGIHSRAELFKRFLNEPGIEIREPPARDNQDLLSRLQAIDKKLDTVIDYSFGPRRVV